MPEQRGRKEVFCGALACVLGAAPIWMLLRDRGTIFRLWSESPQRPELARVA